MGGIVLAGGRSKRMGSAKEWLDFAGVPMLRRVVETVASQTAPVAVARSKGQALPPLPADIILTEDEVDDCGPLGGLAAGLAALEGAADAVFLCSCDVPLLKPAFIRLVAQSLGDYDIAVPWVAGRYHPLAAAYRGRLLPVARKLLAAGERRMHFLFPEARVRVLEPPLLRSADSALYSLLNCNTKEEYRELLRLFDTIGETTRISGEAS